MKSKLNGKAFKFGENIDTDQIIPAEFLVTADPKILGSHAFEKVSPEFIKKVSQGDVIVAEKNFGCGSSREHAPIALLGCGISCVIAESFARIFYRNSINIGLPLVECKIDADDGDEIEVDFENGVVKNITKNTQATFKPLPEFLQNLIDSGGLIEYTKKMIK